MSVGVDNMIVGTVLSTLYLSNQFDLTESKGCSIGKLLDDKHNVWDDKNFDHRNLDFSKTKAMKEIRCVARTLDWDTYNGPAEGEEAVRISKVPFMGPQEVHHYEDIRAYQTQLGGLIMVNCHAGIQFNNTKYNDEVQLIEIAECNNNIFYPSKNYGSTFKIFSGGRNSTFKGRAVYVNSYGSVFPSYHEKINDFFVDANSVAYLVYKDTYYSQMYGNFQDYVDTWCHNITVPFRGKTAQYRQGNKTTTYSSQYDDCVQPEDPLAPFIPVIPEVGAGSSRAPVGLIVGVTLASLLAVAALFLGGCYIVNRALKK